MKVLLTGATGFLGRALLRQLTRSTKVSQVRALTRREVGAEAADIIEWVHCPDILGSPHVATALREMEVVIHAAGRAHVMDETRADPLAEFRRVNKEGTLALARQAAEAGVRRFTFISSIKVNGEGTEPGRPYRADDLPAAADPYGVSKLEAEQGLRSIASKTGMEVVIIRPPLVYGPGVRGNFLSLMRWLDSGIPLPLGAIDNKRSLVALDNLVDLIVTCLDHPAAANQTFLVSDGEDLSTTELLRRMARSLGRSARLLPVPTWLLNAGATILGMRAVSQRLCGSLQVDIGKTKTLLGWAPAISVDEALSRTARHFLGLNPSERRFAG